MQYVVSKVGEGQGAVYHGDEEGMLFRHGDERRGCLPEGLGHCGEGGRGGRVSRGESRGVDICTYHLYIRITYVSMYVCIQIHT